MCPGGGDQANCPVRRERDAGVEDLPRVAFELDRARVEPGGVVSVQVAVQRARTGEGHLCLLCTHDDLRAGEVRKAAGVISVHVGHDQPAHVARLDAQALQLGTDLLLHISSATLTRSRWPARRFP